LWECKLVQTLWRFLKKLKTEHPYDPVILIWASTQKNINQDRVDTCVLMFIAALLKITKLWKKPRYPTTDEWIMKTWYIYTIEYYLATRNNDMGFEGKWIQLENIKISKVSQGQKQKRCMVFLILGR
jgi:hypothetical protein